MALRKAGEIPALLAASAMPRFRLFAHLSKSGADGGFLGWAGSTIYLRAAIEHVIDARHSQFLDVS